MNCDRTGGDDFSRHPAFDVDVGYSDAAKTLNVGLLFDDHVLRADPAGNFSNDVDRHRIFALEIAAKFSFNDRGIAKNARAAEIAFVGQMQIAARANGAAKAGRYFVIAQVNVRAAGRTDC